MTVRITSPRQVALAFCTLLAIVGCSGSSKPPSPALDGSRTITFQNRCKFPVWIGYTGSSASDTPCQSDAQCPGSPGSCDLSTHKCTCGLQPATTDQAAADTQCPTGQKCDLSAHRCGCVPGDAHYQCAEHQVCDGTATSWNQCYWNVDTPSDGSSAGWKLDAHVAGSAAPTKSLTLHGRSTTRDRTVVWSGAFYPKTGCTGAIGYQCASGDCKSCFPWQGATQPQTRAEFTLQNDNDYYDLSLMQGFNVPLQIAVTKPDQTSWDDRGSRSPDYYCGNIGAQKYWSPAVDASNTGTTSTSAWNKFGCSYDFAGLDSSLKPPGWPYYYRLVSAGGGDCNTNKDADCTDPAMPVCGLSAENAMDKKNVTLTCGKLAGYWSDDEVCGANIPHDKEATFVCSESAPLFLCKYDGVESCYQTSSNSQCCGCTNWSLASGDLPWTASCTHPNATWTSNVLPRLKFLKSACPMAYSYAFDDVTSSWQCATKGPVAAPATNPTPNAVNYTLTFCPDGSSGGVVDPGGNAACSGNAWTFVPGEGSAINSVVIHDKDGHPVGEAAGGHNVKLTYDDKKAPYKVTLSSSGTSAPKTCHFSNDSYSCLATAAQAGDDCTPWTIYPVSAEVQAGYMP